MPSSRLHYLDNLRVFAMLFGILVHACTVTDFGPLEVIQEVSSNFRMGTFFAVSGYFAALLLAQKSPGAFLASRVTALAVPFFSGLILLNPVTLWLIFRIHDSPVTISELPHILRLAILQDAPVQGPVIWHLHLWFLLSLCFYTVTAPALLLIQKRLSNMADTIGFLGRIAPFLYPLLVALGVTSFVIGLRAVFKFTLGLFDPPWVVLATVQYWPFYIMGLWLYGQVRIWNIVHRIDPILITSAVIFWLAVSLFAVRDGIMFETVETVRRSLTVCAALFSLLWIFRKFLDRRSYVSALLSGSVYTIYLFHFLVIYMLAALLAPIPDHGSIFLFSVICILTFAMTLSIHVFLIRHSDFLLFIFNGRRKTLRQVKD